MPDDGATGSIPPYSVEDIRRRYAYLSEECYNYLLAVARKHPSSHLQFDPLVMLNVAQSAMDDIWRFKTYHQRDPERLSNSVKRAAYLTKWISRLRPIYFARLESDTDDFTLDKNDSSLLENEKYAIFLSLNTIASELEVSEIILDPEFFADLMYDLHYRHMSDDALLSIYNIVARAVCGESVIMKVMKSES